MEAFNFAFSIFALVMGFTLVEVLAGLVRALKARRRVRIGLMTPMLGIFLMLDILASFNNSWAGRADAVVSYGSLLHDLIVSSLYYLAASFVFPEEGAEVADLDEHYMQNRRLVLAFTMGLGFLNYAIYFAQGGMVGRALAIALVPYYLAALLAFISQRRWINIAALGTLILVYMVWAFIG